MRIKRAFVLALCLAATLIAGCSQGAGSGGSAGAAGSAPQGSAAAVVETPQPVMSNWQEVSFYERPVQEIVDDLELLGFEKYTEQFTDDADYPYYNVAFSGQPEDNAVEGSDSQVVVSLGIYNPQVAEGVEEVTLDSLTGDNALTSYDIYYYFDQTDPSGYEDLARRVADAMGVGAFTDSQVRSLYDGGPEIGGFAGDGAFKGKDQQWSIFVATPSPDAATVLNPEKPTYVSFGYYDTSEQLADLGE